MSPTVKNQNQQPERLPASAAAEAVKKVKDAEKMARAVVLEAHEITSARIFEQAAEEAKRIKENVLAAARKDATERKRSLVEQARRDVAKILSEAEAETAALERTARASLGQAVKKTAAEIAKILEKGSQ